MTDKAAHGVLLDREGRELGIVHVDEVRGTLHRGTFDPTGLPAELRALLTKYQDLAEAQMLSALDPIEAELDAYGFQIVRALGEPPIAIYDLQITADNRLSYRTRSD